MLEDTTNMENNPFYEKILGRLAKSEGDGKFTDFRSADPPTYSGVTLNAMREYGGENFKKITVEQMRAMGGVIYFAPEFKKEHGYEIDITNTKHLAEYNAWSAKKAGKYGAEPLKAETAETLSKKSLNSFNIEHFFERANLSDIKHNGLQYVLFDISVNSGIGSEKRNNGMKGILSRTISKYFPNAEGDSLFEKANNVNPNTLIERIGEERLATYKQIIAKNPEKNLFRDGWINRTHEVTRDALGEDIRVHGGGADKTVASYYKRNKTYGIQGVGSEEFFDTDPSFWKSILNLFKGVLEGLAKLFTPADGVKLADASTANINTKIPQKPNLAQNKTSTPDFS